MAGVVLGDDFASLKTINKTNWATYFNDYLGYVYDSHGCLHLTPADIYLLTRTVQPTTPLRIKPYSLGADDLPASFKSAPYLADLTNGPDDLKKHTEAFRNRTTSLIVYPALNKLFIKIDGQAYAQVKAMAGPKEKFLMVFDVSKDIQWDFWVTTPTDPGPYEILRSTDHYLSNAYYKSTVVPFGAWIVKQKNKWFYKKSGKFVALPNYIAADILRPAAQQQYNYYDIHANTKGQIVAARWAGHDFGRQVLLWTTDGKNHYPEMAYAAGQLVYEQIMLVKDLVHLLTVPGNDDFNAVVAQNKNFVYYQHIAEFVDSSSKVVSGDIDPAARAYYKLYNNLYLTRADYKLIDSRVLKAFKEYRENRLPRGYLARQKALGLYHYLQVNDQIFKKQAHWHNKLKKDWSFWRKLRQDLRADFKKMGVLSQENRQNILEHWFTERLEFRPAYLPNFAKNLQDLSFSTYFKPNDQTSLYTDRERAIMLEKIRQAISGEATDLSFNSVKALNDYNFGLLLNDILGNLYKSHGCMHVSPRNIYFLYELLPVGTKIYIYPYSAVPDQKLLDSLPYLADLADFQTDLAKLKDKFLLTSEVKAVVYPQSGYWIIKLKDQPFAKDRVTAGPQAKLLLVQGREKDGKPIFEDHSAYPTTPGTYYVFKKQEHYLSNIYYETTVVPMGGTIKKHEGKWIFLNKKNEWKKVPKSIELDLSYPPEEQKYVYYDPVKNASNEVLSMKWGSHPFGRYAIQTTKDGKTMHPELIHSSGDLMMEERGLINDLIKVLSAPHDDLDDCIKYSQNFDLYKVCYDYTKDPSKEDLIQERERAAYKLYYGMELTSNEVASLPPDILIANKVMRNEQLNNDEIKILISENIAYRRGGKLKINMQKILGLQFDTYQYVITIQKYAHHYEILKNNWQEISALRRALLKDFKNLVLTDPVLLHNFLRELMVRRTELKRLSEQEALEILRQMI